MNIRFFQFSNYLVYTFLIAMAILFKAGFVLCSSNNIVWLCWHIDIHFEFSNIYSYKWFGVLEVLEVSLNDSG